MERIMKKDQKRRKRIEDAGIDYKCPEIVRIHHYMFSLKVQFNVCFLISDYRLTLKYVIILVIIHKNIAERCRSETVEFLIA